SINSSTATPLYIRALLLHDQPISTFSMAFSLNLISILMCLNLGYHVAIAHPSGPQANRAQQSSSPDLQGSAMAESAAKLSPPCQLAASGLLTGEFGTCANVLGLVSIIEAKQSIVAPIDAWISGACTSAPCSKEGLATASQMIKTGCASDLKQGTIAAVALYSVITHYDVTRDMFCTQYKENSTYCLPHVMDTVESQSGEKMTLGEMISLITGKFTKADRSIMAVPKHAYCNPCGQAIVSQSAIMIDAIRKDPVGIPFNYTSSPTVHLVSDICGPSFEPKELPDSVHVAHNKDGKPTDKTTDNKTA
ncbi:hypothetical protein MJO28_008504, partial [Puccinia striiformis f. sp. tritici]